MQVLEGALRGLGRWGVALSLLCAAAAPIACGKAFVAASSGAGGGSSATSGGGSSATSGGGSPEAGGGGSASVGTGGDTSTSTGNGETELCDNVIDDDNDGLADCDDPDCSAYTCAEVAPNGWTGPVVLREGAAGAPPPMCSGDYAETWATGSTGLLAPEPQCGCQCGPPGDVACTTPFTRIYLDSVCATLSSTLAPSPNGGCGPSGVAVPPATAKGAIPQPSGGLCEALDDPHIPPAMFERVAVVCGGANTGLCALEGHQCVPPAGPGGKTCIYAEGDLDCPRSAYGVRRVMYDGVDDKRSCTACGCGAPEGVVCSGQTNFYKDLCSGVPVASVPNNGLCVQMQADIAGDMFSYHADPPSGGQCEPLGAVPEGSAVGTSPTTVCCTD